MTATSQSSNTYPGEASGNRGEASREWRGKTIESERENEAIRTRAAQTAGTDKRSSRDSPRRPRARPVPVDKRLLP